MKTGATTRALRCLYILLHLLCAICSASCADPLFRSFSRGRRKLMIKRFQKALVPSLAHLSRRRTDGDPVATQRCRRAGF